MKTNDVVVRWTAPALLEAVKRLGACGESLAWLGDEDSAEAEGVEVGTPRTLAEVYEQLHRADWWLWLAARVGVNRKRVALAACACVRTALKYVPEGEARPRHAIELTERWARGEPGVTLKQVRDGVMASRAAADAADAAADDAAAYAAAAAAYAAADAADAAYAAYASAAAAAARAKALADMMPIVREHLPLGLIAEALTRSRTPTESSSS